jgi:hypothetical protein
MVRIVVKTPAPIDEPRRLIAFFDLLLSKLSLFNLKTRSGSRQTSEIDLPHRNSGEFRYGVSGRRGSP